MEIENAAFGTITMDGKTSGTTWLSEFSGEVVKQKKKLSKKYYGASPYPVERQGKILTA